MGSGQYSEVLSGTGWLCEPQCRVGILLWRLPASSPVGVLCFGGCGLEPKATETFLSSFIIAAHLRARQRGDTHANKACAALGVGLDETLMGPFQLKIFYSRMINLPAATDGVVQAETGACTSQHPVPSTHHHLPSYPMGHEAPDGASRSWGESAENGTFPLRSRLGDPSTEGDGADPWRAARGQGWGSLLGGIARQQMLLALVHRVLFLLDDVAAICAEVLAFGRSCALCPRPPKFEQLDAHARWVQPKCCNRVFNIKVSCALC